MLHQTNPKRYLFLFLTILQTSQTTCGDEGDSLTLQPCLEPLHFTNLVNLYNITVTELKNILQQNITQLRIEESSLQSLPNGSFDNFIHLEVLMLRKNDINFIASEAFQGLSRLQVLDLGENVLTDIAAEVFKPLQQLKHLYLDNNCLKSIASLTYLPNLMYLDLSGNNVLNVLQNIPVLHNLTVLKLQNLKISSAEDNTLALLPNLCELDLTNNWFELTDLLLVLQSINPDTIRVLHLGYQKNEYSLRETASTKPSYFDASQLYRLPVMNKLTVLDLSETEIPLHQLNIQSHWPNLVSLNLSSTKMDSFPEWVQNTTIQELDLSATEVQLVKMNSRFVNLKYLLMNRNHIKQVTDPDIFLAFPNLEELQLNGNQMTQISSYVFQHLHHLKILDLSENSLDEIKNYTFHGLDSLTTLLLYSNNIKIYPNNRPFEKLFNLTTLIFHHNSLCEIWTWILPDLVNLEYLDFSQNKIESWNEKTFTNNKNLKELLLDRNDLRRFTDVMLEELSQSHIQLVDLTQNDFQCDDCTMENLQKWLIYKTSNCCVTNCTREETQRCEPYRKITCLNSDGNKISVDYTTVTYNAHCKESKILVLAISISSVSLFLIIVAILLYRFRWYVKYYWYMRFGCLCFSLRKREPAEYVYNAYISYSESDRLWLQNIFLPIMENKNTNLHFYVLERDFEPGRYIIENIMEGLENSCCFIALLSQEYLRNNWRLWEFNWAACRLVSQQTSSFLVLNLGNVKENEMTSTMRSVLRTQMHFKWAAKGPRQKLIWEKMEQLFSKHCIRNSNNNNNTETTDQNTVM